MLYTHAYMHEKVRALPWQDNITDSMYVLILWAPGFLIYQRNLPDVERRSSSLTLFKSNTSSGIRANKYLLDESKYYLRRIPYRIRTVD